eukprot:794536_1
MRVQRKTKEVGDEEIFESKSYSMQLLYACKSMTIMHWILIAVLVSLGVILSLYMGHHSKNVELTKAKTSFRNTFMNYHTLMQSEMSEIVKGINVIGLAMEIIDGYTAPGL